MAQGKLVTAVLFHLIEQREQGGNDVWGDVTSAPDDHENATHTHGELVAFRQALAHVDESVERNLTAEESSNWILEHTSVSFQVCKLASGCT